MSTLDERLERLVTATESHPRMIGSLATVTEENTRQISDLRSSIASLVNVAEQHQRSLELQQHNFETQQQRFEMAISEIQHIGDGIRGIQTENRRILDQLINRDGNGE